MSDWNDEFDAFDFDLSGKTKPGSEAAATAESAAPSAADASGMDAPADAPSAGEAATAHDEAVPEADAQRAEADAEEEAREEEAHQEALSRQEEREQQQSARRKERQQQRADEQAEEQALEQPEAPPSPLSAADLQQVADKQGEQAQAVSALASQLKELLASAGKRRPKGVKSAIRRMEAGADVLLAVQTVVSTVAQTGYPAAYDSLESGKLLKAITQAERALKRVEPKIAKSIDALKQAVEAGDDDTLLLARELKQQAMRLEGDMRTLATALHQATNGYPDEYGQLELFSIIARRGDDEAMQLVDRAMQMAGKVVVHVADAPAMIAALREKDEQAIDAIMRHAIDSFPNSQLLTPNS